PPTPTPFPYTTLFRSLIHGLAPVVEADLFVLAGAHMPAVHHHSGRTDLGGQVDVLLQQLAARDPDPVVQAGHIEHVRSVHEQPHPRLGGRLLQGRGAAVEIDHWPLPSLGVPEEDLGRVGPTSLRLGDRIAGLNMCADDCHASSVSNASSTAGRPTRRLTRRPTRRLSGYPTGQSTGRPPRRLPSPPPGGRSGHPPGGRTSKNGGCGTLAPAIFGCSRARWRRGRTSVVAPGPYGIGHGPAATAGEP